MENSTGSAKRTAATPYGRAYPSRSAPSPTAPACAFGGAPLRGSPGFAGSPSGQMAGLRPGRFTKARPRPRGAARPPAQGRALRAPPGTDSASGKAAMGFQKRSGPGRRATERAPERTGRPQERFFRVGQPNPCQALKKRLRRFLGRPAGLPRAESVLNPEKGQRFQGAGPTHRPHAGTAGEREKGAFRARHPSPRPSRPGGKGASRPLSSGVQPAGRFASLTAPQTRGLGRSSGVKGSASPTSSPVRCSPWRAALRVRLPGVPLTPLPLENRADEGLAAP